MKSKVLTSGRERTFVLVCETGDQPVQELLDFAKRERLASGHFTAIGAFEGVTLGYFDWPRKDYVRIPIREQVEVLSLIGDIAMEGNAPRVHAHAVVGKRDGTAHGGHLLEARVRPTLEIVLVQPPEPLRRRFDPRAKLALIDVEEGPDGAM
jgi:predicted DNA-binding protein with PD1-like motif